MVPPTDIKQNWCQQVHRTMGRARNRARKQGQELGEELGGTSREQHLAHDVSLMFLSQRLEELKKLSPLCSCFEKMSESFSEPCYLRREEDSQISRTQSDLIISLSGGLLFPYGPSGPAVLYHHYRRTCDVRGISLSVSACVCVCCCLHPHCHEDILQRV